MRLVEIMYIAMEMVDALSPSFNMSRIRYTPRGITFVDLQAK